MSSICLHMIPLCFTLLFNNKKIDDENLYKVKYAHNFNSANLMIDENWIDAEVITSFYLPWNKNDPQPTEFKALYDDYNVYFAFQVIDSSLVVQKNISNELDIALQDRVEVYLSASEQLNEYYCLEIDPLGRVLDYRARFYRKFNDKWDAKSIRIESNISENGYNVVLLIPLKQLEKMNIDLSQSFSVGLFRADFKNVGSDIQENWISWIDPKSENPDFHVSEALGLFKLSE